MHQWLSTKTIILLLAAGGDVAALTSSIGMQFDDCAPEGEFCRCSGIVRFGTEQKYLDRQVDGGISCSVDVFGDPVPGSAKFCLCRSYCTACTENYQQPTNRSVLRDKIRDDDHEANEEQKLELDLTIDEPEAFSHLFLNDPDVNNRSSNADFVVYFRTASAQSGAGYGWGAGYCCRKLIARLSLVRLEPTVEVDGVLSVNPDTTSPHPSFPSDGSEVHVWTSGVIKVCTHMATVSKLVGAHHVSNWGSGLNRLSVTLHDPWDMRLVASNSSIFHIHLTHSFNYSALHELRGSNGLFAAAAPLFEGVLSQATHRIFLPSSFYFDVSVHHLKVIASRQHSTLGLWRQTRLRVYLVAPAAAPSPAHDALSPQSHELLALFSQVSAFRCSVHRVRADAPLGLWAGRPQQDRDFQGEEAYRTAYMAFAAAWRRFAADSDSESGEDEWAVFIRDDVVLHPDIRTKVQHGSSGDGGGGGSSSTSSSSSSKVGEWMANALSDLLHLATASGEEFAWLALCGHLASVAASPHQCAHAPFPQHHFCVGRVPACNRLLPARHGYHQAPRAKATLVEPGRQGRAQGRGQLGSGRTVFVGRDARRVRGHLHATASLHTAAHPLTALQCRLIPPP
jgi:hypothetical protein